MSDCFEGLRMEHIRLTYKLVNAFIKNLPEDAATDALKKAVLKGDLSVEEMVKISAISDVLRLADEEDENPFRIIQ